MMEVRDGGRGGDGLDVGGAGGGGEDGDGRGGGGGCVSRGRIAGGGRRAVAGATSNMPVNGRLSGSVSSLLHLSSSACSQVSPVQPSGIADNCNHKSASVQERCYGGADDGGDCERCSGTTSGSLGRERELKDGLDVSDISGGSSSSGRGAMVLSKGRFCRVETADGQIEEIELEIALLMSPNLYRQVACYNNAPASKFPPIVLPKQVTPDALKLIMEYCRFHQAPGRSDKERKIYDEKFIRTLDTKKLCEMASAADSLKMSPLVELTCQALAKMIEGKTPEEVREIFHLPDDLTEEEKLEPMKNAMGDPRIRLLNRLYARKRKELHEKRNTDVKGSPSPQQQHDTTDHRSVDDLLSFIDGEGSVSSKTKKGPRRRKKRNKDHRSHDTGNGLLGHSEEDDDLGSNVHLPSVKGAAGNHRLQLSNQRRQEPSFSSLRCSPQGHGDRLAIATLQGSRSDLNLFGNCQNSARSASLHRTITGTRASGKSQSLLGARVDQQADWQDLLRVRQHRGNGVSPMPCRPLHPVNGGHNNNCKQLGRDLTDTEAVARMLNDEGDFDEDDGLDPVLREQIDKEVEDFAKRLNVGQRWSLRAKPESK